MSEVYFIQRGHDGPIKIGYAANVKSRFAQLQTGCPEALSLLGSAPGARLEEKTLHLKLAKFRIAGEWFHASDEVEAEIKAFLGVDEYPYPYGADDGLASSRKILISREFSMKVADGTIPFNLTDFKVWYSLCAECKPGNIIKTTQTAMAAKSNMHQPAFSSSLKRLRAMGVCVKGQNIIMMNPEYVRKFAPVELPKVMAKYRELASSVVK